jgi:hypothetical protein
LPRRSGIRSEDIPKLVTAPDLNTLQRQSLGYQQHDTIPQKTLTALKENDLAR